MPIRGEASARLSDGRTLTLAVNFATLARAAVAAAIPADDLFKVIKNKDDPRQMFAALVFIEQALRRHHPTITEDALGDLMITDGEALSDALRDAVMGAFGDEEAEQADTGPNPPRRGTGTRSKRAGQKSA